MRGALPIGCLVALLAAAADAHAESPDSVVIAAGDEVVGWFGGRQDVLIMATADLPRSGRAYLGVRALAIGATALARLDDAQLRALLDFIGNCGRAAFVGIDARAYRLLADGAGCGGRFTATVPGGNAVSTTLDALLVRAPRSLPDARALRGLVGESNPDLRLIALFLGGFFALFLLLNAVRTARGAALPLCLLAAALPGLLWAGGSRHAFAAWAEARADDRVARYGRVDVAFSLGRGQERLTPAALARTPQTVDGHGVTLHWNDVPQERYLAWSATLLSEMRLSSIGHFPLAPGLRAEASDGVVRVCNHGRSASRPGWLHWQGDTWRVPALDPAATWTTAEQETVAERTPAARLFERRAPADGPSLLQPLEVAGESGEGQAWLLRFETPHAEVRPCRG